ncbi:helix-turn-helix transcriptional regulator [Nonomuraea dietziae]|uniref:helix-turn-helix domain-containing protein n=1 Tax=Nonomuraea dietziae TaxID=65515 RepID=UPI0031DA02C2
MNEQTIGTVLAEARHTAGLTVAQLSGVTKIREALLYAIERDDFSLCGGDFYIRGHIKAISKAVGLDPEAMVHLYNEQHGGLPRPVKAATVFQSSKGVKLRERGSPNWTMALGVALAIVVVSGSSRSWAARGRSPRPRSHPCPPRGRPCRRTRPSGLLRRAVRRRSRRRTTATSSW